MAGTRRFVKVFLGSPGDLTEERKAAKVVVEDFNSELADTFGCQVELVGWEDTLPELGRPQEVINRDLDGCDLFVGMLWKRWGTPPGASQYTSGFEEEFERSLARTEKEGRPAISLLLKQFTDSELTDPGEQLKRVIAFRERIFAERKLLAGTFVDLSDFQRKFRKCVVGFVKRQTESEAEVASEKDQSPLAERQTTQVVEPGSTTPLSVEGARFLRQFVSAAEKASDEQPLAAEEVARLRLLAIIAAVHGNDQQSLGSHDANLLFKARTEFEFGRRELIELLDIGLEHFKHENVPMWHWLAAVNGFKGDMLPIGSVIGSTERRVGALKAMRLIAEPIDEGIEFGRKDIVPSWFLQGTDSAVRVAALEYLAECGHPSDLPCINVEFQKNETQTASAAANAIVRITLRNDRRAALEALYDLQPTAVRSDLLDVLFSRSAEFDNATLLRGVTHRSASVRKTVVKLLRSRSALSASVAEQLLKDSDAEVRFEAMQALIASGRTYSVDQARVVLVRQGANAPGSGLFATSQTDTEGEAVMERYIVQCFDGLSVAQIEEEARWSIFDQKAYFALIRREFKSRGDDLRRDVENEFVDRFETLVGEMEKRYGAQAEIIEKTRSLGKHLRGKFTREGLDIICRKMDVADLQLVRSMLARGSLDYSAADLSYLAKFGEWCDVPLIVSSIERPKYGRKFSTLLSMAGSTKYDDAARTLYALGRHRPGELLRTAMPGTLLARVIPLIPDKAFAGLSDIEIAPLMRSENEDVRKFASLKYMRVFNRRRIENFLDIYMAEEQFYYNVIHWFDFGTSVPRDRMLRAAGKALTEA